MVGEKWKLSKRFMIRGEWLQCLNRSLNYYKTFIKCRKKQLKK